jgi:tRNA A37 threonylcarbamoyladenosine dehydratase
VRSGIGRLIVIDKDEVEASNLNRQIIATEDTVGQQKVEVFAQRARSINPDVQIIKHAAFMNEDNLEEFFREKVDFVIDAIDTLSPKMHRMRICHQNGIPSVSCMGSGGKRNPQLIQIADISKTYNCRLALMLRKRLHRLGIYKGITVVFSPELVDKSAIVEEESVNKKSNVGTISYIPVVFGCMCAYACVEYLTNQSQSSH